VYEDELTLPFCGQCLTPLEPRGDPAHRTWTCPGCGDTRDIRSSGTGKGDAPDESATELSYSVRSCRRCTADMSPLRAGDGRRFWHCPRCGRRERH
jgi:predicted RNA-binding Zn-ribbon protein involved in translation (DUF1610 family)